MAVSGVRRSWLTDESSADFNSSVRALAAVSAITVPVLWDKQTGRIVNNESSEIMRMLGTAFDHLGALKLVYPHDADIEAGRISIMSLVGAGLIGLRAGQSISWPDRSGHERSLRIIEVMQS